MPSYRARGSPIHISSNEKLFKYLILAFIVGSALMGVAHAQVSNPSVVKKVGNNIVPVASGTTLGSSSVNGAFHNISISGTCAGAGCGTGGGEINFAGRFKQFRSSSIMEAASARTSSLTFNPLNGAFCRYRHVHHDQRTDNRNATVCRPVLRIRLWRSEQQRIRSTPFPPEDDSMNRTASRHTRRRS